MSKNENNIHDNPNNWHGFIYNNPNDPRIMVPKRNKYMGWTVNFGHPKGKLITCGFIAFMFAVFGSVAYMGIKDYRYKFEGSKFHINAAMYDYTIDKSQIASISTIKGTPPGRRTNGYGGIKKAYGHFTLEGYGKSRLYAYKSVNMYIVIQLEGNKPTHVIFNDKTLEKTEALYKDIQIWYKSK
ncbi:MAG: DUF5808 domain-containing protein [Anaerovoracaceae bacterium]|jgi:hypothetical protein